MATAEPTSERPSSRSLTRRRFAARSEPKERAAGAGATRMLPPMELRRFTDVDDFLDLAGDFLGAREAEHNLLLGVPSNVATRPSVSAPPYLATVTDDDRVVAVALRTPPCQLVLSEMDDPAAIHLLVEDLVARDLPGAIGRSTTAGLRGGAGRPRRPDAPSDDLRTDLPLDRRHAAASRSGYGADRGGADRALVETWLEAFSEKRLSRPPPGLRGDGRALARRRGRTPTSGKTRAATSSRWPGSAAKRRTASASGRSTRRPRSAAAATRARSSPPLSQAQLDDGRTFCFLFTDLANPTSNHIYQAIGYEPVRDVDVCGTTRFSAPRTRTDPEPQPRTPRPRPATPNRHLVGPASGDDPPTSRP